MSDLDMELLVREVRPNFLAESAAIRAVIETGLGIAKLRICANNPGAWFVTALDVAPPPPLEEIGIGLLSCAWLAPNEWLVTGPEPEVESLRRRSAELVGSEGLMVDLTHGCAAYEVSGLGARSVLAAHCPLDLGADATPVGAARRSLFSDAGFFISRRPDRLGKPCFRLIFDQTMAGYAERLLRATIIGASL